MTYKIEFTFNRIKVANIYKFPKNILKCSHSHKAYLLDFVLFNKYNIQISGLKFSKHNYN